MENSKINVRLSDQVAKMKKTKIFNELENLIDTDLINIATLYIAKTDDYYELVFDILADDVGVNLRNTNIPLKNGKAMPIFELYDNRITKPDDISKYIEVFENLNIILEFFEKTNLLKTDILIWEMA